MEPSSQPKAGGEDKPDSGSPTADNVGVAEGVGPITTVLLTPGNLEILLVNPSGPGNDIAADADTHLLLVKGEAICRALDQFAEAVSSLWWTDLSTLRAPAEIPEKAGLLLAPGGLPAHAKALITDKSNAPTELAQRIRHGVTDFCARLGLSSSEKSVVLSAAEVYLLAKLCRPDAEPGAAKSRGDAAAKSLRQLAEQPVLIPILRSLYGGVGQSDAEPSVITRAANVLTAADLIFACLDLEDRLSRETLSALQPELDKLTGTLFLPQVAEAVAGMLKEEAARCDAQAKSCRVMVFTDRPDRVFSLEARLRNEGFQAGTTDSLDAFVAAIKRRRPHVLIIRLHSLPLTVVKTLQYLSCKGINLSTMPSFLLVKSTLVRRLATLLEIGIEDIIDTDGSLDVLMLKLKKVRAKLESPTPAGPDGAQEQSGSRGTLSDMNLIALLQALGAGQRTAKVTIQPKSSPASSLELYLNRGAIAFARLGEVVGENAVYEALEWKDGTWVVEQVAESDLPQPNTQLSNDAILLEGCRLMDERARAAPVG